MCLRCIMRMQNDVLSMDDLPMEARFTLSEDGIEVKGFHTDEDGELKPGAPGQLSVLIAVHALTTVLELACSNQPELFAHLLPGILRAGMGEADEAITEAINEEWDLDSIMKDGAEPAEEESSSPFGPGLPWPNGLGSAGA